jgi:hypothetical protein
VALAGDHAPRETEAWNEIGAQAYLYFVGFLGVALLALFPPHFDLHLNTIAAVAFVAFFLISMERPLKTVAVEAVAPLTAIMAASAVIFGAWTIVLAICSWVAIRYRLASTKGHWRALIGVRTFGQVGIAIIVAYAVVWGWVGLHELITLAPRFLENFLTLLSVIALGLLWQTLSNVLAYPWYLMLGRPFDMSQLLRTGVIASVYAYLLVALYRFGGLLAATVFYMVVAQIRVIQDVLGITAQLHKLERAQAQVRGLVRDLMHFTDTPDVEFFMEVQNIAQMIARRLGLPSKDVELLGLAAELHEMGKSKLSARIRNGQGLNPKEEAQRLTYSRWGGLMIRATDALFPQQVADWIEFHGEHFDGSGYPRGLKGDAIPLPSRILAVARDYVRFLTGYDGAPALEKEKALALLRERSGTLYDPRIVTALYEIVS